MLYEMAEDANEKMQRRDSLVLVTERDQQFKPLKEREE